MIEYGFNHNYHRKTGVEVWIYIFFLIIQTSTLIFLWSFIIFAEYCSMCESITLDTLYCSKWMHPSCLPKIYSILFLTLLLQCIKTFTFFCKKGRLYIKLDVWTWNKFKSKYTALQKLKYNLLYCFLLLCLILKLMDLRAWN